MKKVSWVLFGILSTVIGLYPLLYLFLDRNFSIENNIGLLSTKSVEILSDTLWNICFYGHISFGGIALLIGWVQFSKKLRAKNIGLHKKIGKTYVVAVIISGLCSIYIGYYATAGIISALGFICLGIFWLFTTILGFKAIKEGNINLHKKLMIYSYAACFAAVTLRVWLPILTISIGEFDPAYRIVAWLCWIPNIIVAYFIIHKQRKKNTLPYQHQEQSSSIN